MESMKAFSLFCFSENEIGHNLYAITHEMSHKRIKHKYNTKRVL